MKLDDLLDKLDACREAKEWARGKDWSEIYSTCPRSDWLLWLFSRTNPDDRRLRVLAAAKCADTVRHLHSVKPLPPKGREHLLNHYLVL